MTAKPKKTPTRGGGKKPAKADGMPKTTRRSAKRQKAPKKTPKEIREENSRRDRAMVAILDYLYFILDNQPKSTEEVAAFDSHRESLHRKIAESVGFTPSAPYSPWKSYCNVFDSAGNYEDYFDTVEQYAEFCYYSIVDNMSTMPGASGLETKYSVKFRIEDTIERTSKRVADKISIVEKLVTAYRDDMEKWNKTNESNPFYERKYDWEFLHALNGEKFVIEHNIGILRKLSTLPMEAYTEATVSECYDKPIRTIEECLKTLGNIGFKCLREHRKSRFWRFGKTDLSKIIGILSEFNEWRRGVGDYMWTDDPAKTRQLPHTPAEIGSAIEAAIDALKAEQSFLAP